jgi:photosystem II stability/assembly factor-like uncharacterized protein
MNLGRALLALATLGSSLSFAQQTSNKPTVDPFQNLRFRNLGPAIAGGRVSSVIGIPGNAKIYYAGSAGGGIFKSEDGGATWKPIFENQATGSIGALALTPSNPNLVWAGTGEPNLRNDITTGKGVYYSPDAGKTWQFRGLADAGQIANVIVDAHNPENVLVGAVGHAWGPNAERGVFRTTDSGKSWQKVLYIDDKTGVSDMTVDPANSMVVYAGMWQVQRHPWEMVSGGASSGIYRSLDGGATWTKLSEGLPKAPLGRIGLAIAPSNPRHIYALIESKEGVLWESKDSGDHWTKVTDNMLINARPWYFGRFAVAPNNEAKLYFLSFDLMMSEDGGKTSHNIGRGVHADHHAIWIDPTDPQHILEGNDGGVYLSWNGGESWSFLNGLPIEQMYSVALDDKTPYTICAGLQDNSAWCGPSRTLNGGAIPNSEWWTTLGGDGQYAVPVAGSNLIYSDSQNGFAEVLDRESGRTRHIRPYSMSQEDLAPTELKYRFNWTTPIAVSAKDPKDVYLGANVLFHSTDSGTTWKSISPDLTRNDRAKQVLTGGPIANDLSGAENYDTILSLALSQQDPQTIWVGTDDGLVQVTRDGGQHWSNVTPKGAPEWGRVQQIEVSPFDPQTAYVAIDCHESDDNKPYVFRTHDAGKTWTSITSGLPLSDPARVVRENPNRKGMLVLGTDTGLFLSFDEGGHWTAWKSDFPTTPIYDLKFHKTTHDLVVATHGRGLYVFDDLTAIENWKAEFEGAGLNVFPIQSANFWNGFNKYGRANSNGSAWSAANRSKAAFVHYWLPRSIESTAAQRKLGQSPVKVTITDESGKVVRTLYGPTRAGINRVSWDLTHEAPTKLQFTAAPRDEESPSSGAGPLVLPGPYKVTVTVAGQSQTAPVEVSGDPRFTFDADAFHKQHEVALALRDEISRVNEALNRSASLKTQLNTVEQMFNGEGGGEKYRSLLERAQALQKRIADWQEPIYNPAVQNDSKYYLHYLARLHDRLTRLMSNISADYDTAPSDEMTGELAALKGQVQTQVASFNKILDSEVSAFNQVAQQVGAPTIYAQAVETRSGN